MDSDQLESWQIEKIKERVRECLHYLHRLKRRMEQSGFHPHDPLLLKVVAAEEAVHTLFVECHYMSCETGAGRHRSRTSGSKDQPPEGS
jgi:hypothetical protein